jgi:hypothetical protein
MPPLTANANMSRYYPRIPLSSVAIVCSRLGMKRLAWGSRSRVPLHGFGAPPPRTFWCAAAAYMLAAMPITAQAERLPLDRDLWREG